MLASAAHPPMLRAWISLAVGAPIAARSSSAGSGRCASASARSRLHRPRGLQHALFFDHLPRTDGGAITDYLQQMTVEQFGAMVPTATAEVGSRKGIYIGFSPAAAAAGAL